ncbi:MAG TPA: DNA polymerase [Rhizobacter sp.]
MLKIVSSQKDAKVLDAVLRQVLPYVDTPHQVMPFESMLPAANAGDVVLGLGGQLVDHVKASEHFPTVKNNKNVTLNSLRGIPLDWQQGKLMLSYDPFMATVDPAMEPQCVWDVRLACRLHDTGALQPQLGKYSWVEDFAAAIAFVEQQHEATGKPVPVAWDLETIGLDPLHPGDDERPPARIITISVTVREGMAHVLRVPAGGVLTPLQQKHVRWLLTTPKVNSVGANLKFDVNWVAIHWSIVCTNQKADTMLIGSLLDENRSNSLNLHAKMHTTMGGYDDDFNDRFDKSRMDIALETDPAAFLTYAGGDTDAALRTYNVMRPRLINDKPLTAFYTQLMQPAAKVFAKVERRGVVVDLDRYKALQSEVQADIERLTDEALAMVPKRIRNKYAEVEKEKLLGKKGFLEDFLFTPMGLNLKPLMMTPSGKDPSTAKEHLEMFADHPDAKAFVDVMSALNGSKKTMSTYIVGFMKHLRSDGRFHPTYMLHRGDYDGGDSGTVTGRTSAKDPAYQTIPKHTKWAKKLREVYTCPPGMAILKADFSQGELRVTACVANERSMLETYRKGIDLHLRTGALVNHLTLEEALALKAAATKGSPEEKRIKMIRQGGKAGNFGLIYGMSAAGFQNYARIAYGVHMTLQEAEAFRNAFFAEYPGLLQWHERFKKHAHMHGFVRSPLGRIRHLPLIHSRRNELRSEAERQSINSPIQSCLSDMMQLGMVELDRAYPDLWIFGMTHDDVGMYVPEGEVMEWAQRVQAILQDLPLAKFGWQPQLQFVSDCEASHTNLAECEELKLAA